MCRGLENLVLVDGLEAVRRGRGLQRLAVPAKRARRVHQVEEQVVRVVRERMQLQTIKLCKVWWGKGKIERNETKVKRKKKKKKT